ncbi:lycopene cyclase family protein [Saccharothrix variisporea]|uniref:Lycopene cyclase (CrtL-type) n=1 Tax=Saccharothrix variisporea TaxID=543527 RepID=A0A495XHI2_9PSEU|nr:lycopene cyclase family protein [Saccharothrix variisporea]RKT73931.1 lycopene cyclase (CrtL-type) [Saccharothrix variisporea]
MDVLVVGGGPAGRALARACAAIGLETTVVDPRPDRPWRATYAAWSDELPEGAPVAVETSRTRVWAVREHRLGRGYAVLDNEGLRALPPDVRVVRGTVVAKTSTAVRLADGRVLRARRVVDASGTGTGTRAGSSTSGGGRAAQHAVGVVVPRDGWLDGDEAVVMDWRKPPDAGMPDPSFLYVVPVSASEVLVEETSLARRPGLPLGELRRRLHARLDKRGVSVPREEERVRIVLDAPRRENAFGAAGGLLHPATGYSVAAALRLAPAVARAVADGDPVDRVVWSPGTRTVHALRRFGLEALLRMRPDEVPEFFDHFFQMPENQQRNYLGDRSDLRGTVHAMSGLFRAAPWRLRARLAFALQPAKAERTPG